MKLWVRENRKIERGRLQLNLASFSIHGSDADNDSALTHALPDIETQNLPGAVVHVFTHFRLTLKVERLTAPPRFKPPAAHIWVHPKDFPDTALPSVMRKVVTHVLG